MFNRKIIKNCSCCGSIFINDATYTDINYSNNMCLSCNSKNSIDRDLHKTKNSNNSNNQQYPYLYKEQER